MPRRMSCSMTVDAVRDRTKTVTRRHVDTWQNLKAGDRLTLIEKGMGLAKGERQVVLAEVEVVDVRVEPVCMVDEHEVAAEGFPGHDPDVWRTWWAWNHGYRPPADLPPGLDAACHWADGVECRRIEWRYLDEAAS